MDKIPAEITRAVVEIIGGILIAVISGYLAWQAGKPKQAAEVDNYNAEASHSIAAAADVTTNAAMRAVEMLEERFEKESEATQIKIIKLQNEVRQWKSAYDELMKKHDELKKAFDGLQSDCERFKGIARAQFPAMEKE